MSKIHVWPGWTRLLVTLVLAVQLPGCASRGVTYHDPQMDFGSIQTVAVLPFANLTREAPAAERVRDTFSTMLLATGALYVIPPGEVARGISRSGMMEPTAPAVEEVKKFAAITEVDAIFTGVVREYGEVRSGSSVANTLSLSVRMMDRETGAVIWTADTTMGGIGMSERLLGGGGKPMDQVTRNVINELLDKLFN